MFCFCRSFRYFDYFYAMGAVQTGFYKDETSNKRYTNRHMSQISKRLNLTNTRFLFCLSEPFLYLVVRNYLWVDGVCLLSLARVFYKQSNYSFLLKMVKTRLFLEQWKIKIISRFMNETRFHTIPSTLAFDGFYYRWIVPERLYSNLNLDFFPRNPRERGILVRNARCGLEDVAIRVKGPCDCGVRLKSMGSMNNCTVYREGEE